MEEFCYEKFSPTPNVHDKSGMNPWLVTNEHATNIYCAYPMMKLSAPFCI